MYVTRVKIGTVLISKGENNMPKKCFNVHKRTGDYETLYINCGGKPRFKTLKEFYKISEYRRIKEKVENNG